MHYLLKRPDNFCHVKSNMLIIRIILYFDLIFYRYWVVKSVHPLCQSEILGRRVSIQFREFMVFSDHQVPYSIYIFVNSVARRLIF